MVYYTIPPNRILIIGAPTLAELPRHQPMKFHGPGICSRPIRCAPQVPSNLLPLLQATLQGQRKLNLCFRQRTTCLTPRHPHTPWFTFSDRKTLDPEAQSATSRSFGRVLQCILRTAFSLRQLNRRGAQSGATHGFEGNWCERSSDLITERLRAGRDCGWHFGKGPLQFEEGFGTDSKIISIARNPNNTLR